MSEMDLESSSPAPTAQDTVAALRSRVDQQSTLIAMLKQRGDNTLTELTASQTNYKILSGQFESLQEKLSRDDLQHKQLEQRFSLLAENHEEMIRIKDGYKAANLDLQTKHKSYLSNKCERCIRLEKELTKTKASLSNSEKICSTLSSDCSTFQLKITQLEEELEAARSARDKESKHLSQKIRDCKEQVCRLELHCKNKDGCNQQLQTCVQCLESDKGSISKELVSQRSLLSRSEQNLRDSLDRERTLQESFRLRSEEVSKDVCVKQLRRQLFETEEKFSIIENDFDAYKKHSSQLLAHERELNNKLRHILD